MEKNTDIETEAGVLGFGAWGFRRSVPSGGQGFVLIWGAGIRILRLQGQPSSINSQTLEGSEDLGLLRLR